ncbi:hypothetical protein OKJ48_03020 [Streptomyces kunmingensis]|uniref:Integral membrane protein n=1 Tax=Streptomyces kunmingensis TaxID=68225 RepID=A0ABU6C3N6_9ACTN|nr:hypothetical protein [Streptomyces kunmingensis]MEB3959232.1 hypothetical protein [Streptomyces kunmingensis]
MNQPAPYQPTAAADAVHYPTPIPATAPMVPVHNGQIPAVQTIVLPDGRAVTGYAVNPMQPEPIAAKPPVSRAAVNVALGGVGFLAVCGGLLMLTTFIAALTALITQLIILAAVVFGGFIAVQLFAGARGGTTVNIRKAVIKRNHFHG